MTVQRRIIGLAVFAGVAAVILILFSGCRQNTNAPVVIFTDSIPTAKKVKDTVPPPRATDMVKGYDTVRHDRKVSMIKKGNYEVVLVGNSIIHTLGEFGGKYKPLEAVWTKHFGKRKAINLGYSGYRTENILWNLSNGELDFTQSPKLFILLIGTNNMDERRFKTVHTPGEVTEGTSAIVKLISSKHPASKILVLRLFPRGGDDEKGEGKNIFHSSKTCIENTMKAGLLTKQLADSSRVFWADVDTVFLQKNGKINAKRMPDLLHPNAAGAEAWVAALEPTLRALLDEKKTVAPKNKTQQ